jgi:hypothetical protein
VKKKKMKETAFWIDFCGVAGGVVAVLPWVFLDQPGWGALLITSCGAVLAGISRANSLAVILKMGRPGEDLFNDVKDRAKVLFNRFKNFWYQKE